jgi:hypothetical protein
MGLSRRVLLPRPTPLPTGMRGWLDTFANPFCAALPCEERGGFLDAMRTGVGRRIMLAFALLLSNPETSLFAVPVT